MTACTPRPNVRLVTCRPGRGTPPADLADAFARMVTSALAETAWQDRALCAEVGGDLWFPENGEPSRDAKRVCMSCEVRAECLEYALSNDEKFGIWGGLSERQRSALKRQRERRVA